MRGHSQSSNNRFVMNARPYEDFEDDELGAGLALTNLYVPPQTSITQLNENNSTNMQSVYMVDSIRSILHFSKKK